MQWTGRETAFQLLGRQAAGCPEAVVVVAANATLTYAALGDRAQRLAGRLAAEGIRDTRIGLLCNNRVEWLEVFFAASALGCQLVPISTWSTASELDFILRDSQVTCLFAIAGFGGQDFAAAVDASVAAGAGIARRVLIDGPTRTGWTPYARLFDGQALLPPSRSEVSASPGVILYTSGSSNRPKAVPLTDAKSLSNGFNIGERQGLRSTDRVLISIPLFWSYGAANALPATLTHGATLVLQSRFEPGEALDLIEQHQCTAIYTLPAMTSALLAHPKFAPARTRSLRTGVTIGSPQDVIKAARDLGVSGICNIYGSTESYGNCCVTPHTWPLERRATCQGPPLPGVEMRIRDAETGALVVDGTVGQVEVGGAFLTEGYIGDSARHNADVLTADGWFRTGDLGRLQDDGTFVYAGRSSEMIKRSGINVSPAEVEEVLQQHPDVGLAGVTGVADPVRDEIIIAFVVPRPGRHLEAETLIGHCRTQLSGYKVPDQIHICEALPLTATGKLMRRELKSLAAKPRDVK